MTNRLISTGGAWMIKKHTNIIRMSAAVLLGIMICVAARPDGGMIKAYAATTVEYDKLRELISEGNSDIKNSDSLSNIKNIEHQLEVLKSETQSLAANSRIYADDTETSSQYKSSANILNRSITQLEKQLTNQTKESSSLNKSIDTLTMSAQAAMISYLQMQENADASEKQAEAVKVKYDNALTRQAAGAATEAEVLEARTDMVSAEAQSLSYKQQAQSLRSAFLDMLGISDSSDVVIAKLSEPDTAAIEAIDPDTDKTNAVNNDSTVKSVRHQSSSSSASKDIKDMSEEQAVGNAEASYDEAYTLLKTSLEEYNAAKKGLTVAENNYAALGRKKTAGMLTKAAELEGEAEYIQSKAQYENAAMSLTSAYENYKWMMKGYSSSSGAGGATGRN